MNIGIDIGGSHIAAGLVTNEGELIDKETRDVNIFSPNIIEEEINILLEKHNLKKEDISKIGVAAPGNPSKTCIRNLVNLGIEEFNITSFLQERYNIEVHIKNDGKCAGLAEKKYGALQNYNDAVFLCMGTGVGSAVFLNGELLEPTRASRI